MIKLAISHVLGRTRYRVEEPGKLKENLVKG